MRTCGALTRNTLPRAAVFVTHDLAEAGRAIGSYRCSEPPTGPTIADVLRNPPAEPQASPLQTDTRLDEFHAQARSLFKEWLVNHDAWSMTGVGGLRSCVAGLPRRQRGSASIDWPLYHQVQWVWWRRSLSQPRTRLRWRAKPGIDHRGHRLAFAAHEQRSIDGTVCHP
jgi:hypothetical protein